MSKIDPDQRYLKVEHPNIQQKFKMSKFRLGGIRASVLFPVSSVENAIVMVEIHA